MNRPARSLPNKEHIRNLIQLGQLGQAKIACRMVCENNPDDAETWFLLGTVNGVLGDYQEAEDCLQRVVVMAPSVPMAHYNLGIARMNLGKASMAEVSFRRAVALNPQWPAAHCDLGNALKVQFQYEAAVNCYRRAIMLDSSYVGAYHSLGAVYHDQGMIELAKEAYQNAIDISTSRGEAVDGAKIRLTTILPVVVASVEQLEQVRHDLDCELEKLLHQQLQVVQPDKEIATTNFLLAYHGKNDRELQAKLAQVYLKACPSLAYEAPFCRGYRPPIAKERKIRIGFISRYFKNHSIGKTSSGIIAKLSREHFDVHTLFLEPPQDELGRFLAQHSDHAIVLPAQLDTARRRIAELELDILFYQDIGMDSFTFFLAFSRLAPVQCTSFGHPETTGIPNLDYYISTDYWEPTGAKPHYSEQLVLLRNVASVAYYYEPKLPKEWKPRASYDLPEEATLYICPQSLFKYHPEFDALLAEILRRDPSGRLVLIESIHSYWGELLRARFQRYIPDVTDRIMFVPQQSFADYLNVIAVSDVMLDTIHFCGFNTSMEGFAVGTPVVTLPGEFMRSRHTMSLYRKMDLWDCVAKDKAEYVDIAVRLGTDREFRQAVVKKIAGRRHLLWEELEVIREFERFFLSAVEAKSGA